ncbi:MAG: TetR/AcrR family transcriptional regulator [Pseudobdellovibrionaceae bacterium]
MSKPIAPPKVTAKEKLIAAAFALIRAQGYSSTTVDDLCAKAGVTKGAFFHHFESKEALAVAAADFWTKRNIGFFGSAPFHQHKDPLDRFIGYIEFRREILRGEIPDFTCLVGTMVQEAYDSHPEIRKACETSIFGHAETLEQDINEAIKLYKTPHSFTAKSLALHTQAVIQGAFILTKAQGSAEIALDSIDHLKRYVQLLFDKP